MINRIGMETSEKRQIVRKYVEHNKCEWINLTDEEVNHVFELYSNGNITKPSREIIPKPRSCLI